MRIRVGIIGTGFAARAHVDALRRVPAVEVVAVASRSMDRAKRFAREYGIDGVHSDYEGVIKNPRVESIHICAANDVHAELCTLAMRSEKHVLCEKPLGVDSGETAALATLAAEVAAHGVRSGVCFNYRFYPLVCEIRERVSEPAVGPVHFVHGRYLQDWLLKATDWNWRVDAAVGGASRAVADIGSHWCDLAQFVMRDRITRVFADINVLHESRVRPDHAVGSFSPASHNGSSSIEVVNEDFGTLLLQFASGSRGAVTLSQVSAGRKNGLMIEFDGPSASFVWDAENSDRAWIGSREGPNLELIRDPLALTGAAAALSRYPAGHTEGWADALRNLIADFYEAVDAAPGGTGSPGAVASFAEAHRIVELVEAAALSSRSGRWVEVGDRAGVTT
jgi:predicted dehydrogenase